MPINLANMTGGQRTESYTTLFGPADILNIQTDIDEDEMERIEEEVRPGCEKIKQGHKRIMKKNLKNKTDAITNGRRSGSRKIELEHYDTETNLFSV